MQSGKRYKKSGKKISREAFKENEVKMIKITFQQKTARRDIYQLQTEVLE